MSILRLTFAALAALTLSACGNDPNSGSGTRAVVTSVKALTAKVLGRSEAGTPGAGASAAQAANPLVLVDAALRATPGKVMLAVIEDRDIVAIMGVAQTNQGYETWEAADRRSLILKHGVLTASRGLGDDLMSANADATIAILRARRDGQATRSYQFLTGLGDTRDLVINCAIAQIGAEQVQFGEIDLPATMFAETCMSGPLKIQNLFWVDGRGDILKSRQWVSDAVGYAVFLHLRK